MDEFKYKDILNYRYPNSEIEKDFPDKILREAQFAPFAALTGHDQAILETARLTDKKIEIDEYEKNELNRRLGIIKENPDVFGEISVTYFLPDEKKAGGKYVSKKGIIKKIREYENDIVFYDNTKVPVEDILYIESDLFEYLI